VHRMGVIRHLRQDMAIHRLGLPAPALSMMGKGGLHQLLKLFGVACHFLENC